MWQENLVERVGQLQAYLDLIVSHLTLINVNEFTLSVTKLGSNPMTQDNYPNFFSYQRWLCTFITAVFLSPSRIQPKLTILSSCSQKQWTCHMELIQIKLFALQSLFHMPIVTVICWCLLFHKKYFCYFHFNNAPGNSVRLGWGLRFIESQRTQT